MAHIIITKCHHNLCWEMKESHARLHAGGTIDPCPKTVAKAMEMLNDKANKSKHPPPQQPKKQQPNQNKDSNNVWTRQHECNSFGKKWEVKLWEENPAFEHQILLHH